jgi:phage recombination protein Bet
MGTAIAEQPKQSAADKVITYVPLGGKTSVELTMTMVKKFLCVPTRQGNIASDADIVKFMMLCKARELDPWVGDAYLVGYDSSDGPVFSLITAAQALLKRAEISPEYNGMESGVILAGKDGTITYRDGDLVLDNETLVGGWARCHRKDREHPSFDALKLSTFSTGRSRWEKDPAGMIVKCAESSALRKAFPTQLGGLYSKEEMDHLSETRIDKRNAGSVSPMVTASNLDQLAASIEKEFKTQPTLTQDAPTLADRFTACKTHKEALKLRDEICDPESTATEDEIAAAGELYDQWVKDHKPA